MAGAEPIGHVDHLVNRRIKAVSRLSDMARSLSFPKLYARPQPIEIGKELREEIARLKLELATRTNERDRLQAKYDDLLKQTNDDPLVVGVPVPDILKAYIQALAIMGVTYNGEPYSMVHLVNQTRSYPCAHPRQVGMWLCRKLSTKSLPQISRHFGGRDHTTVMHGCRNAVGLMQKRPELRQAAQIVLAKYGAHQ